MAVNTAPNLLPRPPIVVIMGHVDHGKTTLLDYIRKSNVASREAGGITQAIGAYEIEHKTKDPQHPAINLSRRITFIDTPGHEAFTKMRSRGATAADLAILVIAAEESLKPQSKEAIKILNETKTPFIVAVNKIDKPEANLEKVKNDLAMEGVMLEGYGGNISYQPISAKTGQGVEELLDLILLASDLENLTYDQSAPASGYVLESKIDTRRGMSVSIVMRNGVLKIGDTIVTPSAKGKIKMLESFLGEKLTKIIPSAPALVIGFETLPGVGEEFKVVDGKSSDLELKNQLERPQNIVVAFKEAEENKINLIVKAGDSGSLEAIVAIVKSLSGEKIIEVIGESVGDITDADVKAAIASNCLVIGFKSRVPKTSQQLAEIHKIKIITSEIIYDLVKSVEEALKGPIGPALTGRLEVLAVFNQQKLNKQLVGGKVVEGVIKNRAQLEIKREGKLIGQGKILNLQSQKQDVSVVEMGKECGIVVNSSAAILVGDEISIK